MTGGRVCEPVSVEHLAGRGLALGVVGGAMHGPAAVGGVVSDQDQLKIADGRRHPLDDRLVALSEHLEREHVPATAAELVMEARDEVARLYGLVLSHFPVLVDSCRISAEVIEQIDQGAIVRLDPEFDVRVLQCAACDVSESPAGVAGRTGEDEEGDELDGVDVQSCPCCGGGSIGIDGDGELVVTCSLCGYGDEVKEGGSA